jgi:glucose/arabinose dehydrogenase
MDVYSTMIARHVEKLIVFIILSLLLVQISINIAYAEPITADSQFTIERIFSGSFEPSTMAFVASDDILVLDRDEGKVFRIINGTQSRPLIDVNVSTDGYRGLLGVAVSSKDDLTTNVFLYFTEAPIHDGDDSTKNPVHPLGNRLYKYDLLDNKLVHPKLLLDLPALPGPRHAGGIVAIGPDHNLYITIGDLDGTFRYKQYETMAQNYRNGQPVDGRGGILVISQDGKPLSQGILGNSFPLNLYYAYGIRNSFGIDWDPLTNYLWDSENGPNFGDELNLVYPGFNSGWSMVQGFWKPNIEDKGHVARNPDLVDFDGKGIYSPPKFVWADPVAPSAIRFLDSERYGNDYENDLLVGDANYGNIYDFDLDAQRKNLNLSGILSDATANNIEEAKDLIFAEGFGKIADVKIGPNGMIYVLSKDKDTTSIYRIKP